MTELDLCIRVSNLIRGLGLKTALIGAGAMAVHGYERATNDLDLAVVADLLTQFRPLAEALRKDNPSSEVVLSEPDMDDPLGGVISVQLEDGALVEVVNFHNDGNRGAGMLAFEAIAHAESTNIGVGEVAVVRREYLIALKVYAGGMQSVADIANLLELDPSVLEEVRRICGKHRLAERLDRLLKAAESLGS